MEEEATISVFVDESGNLSCARDSSRFYIVSLVVHNQADSIGDLVQGLDAAYAAMGFPNLCFHAGPLIRREDGYEYMSWELRSRIFSKMMAFARRAPFRYRCLCIDKRFVSSEAQVLADLKLGIVDFLDTVCHAGKVKVYYDCGQAVLTNLIHDVMSERYGGGWEFAHGVRPSRYRLFQVADLVCTVSLIERRLSECLSMTRSEYAFFGGPRNFKRMVLKPLRRKLV